MRKYIDVNKLKEMVNHQYSYCHSYVGTKKRHIQRSFASFLNLLLIVRLFQTICRRLCVLRIANTQVRYKNLAEGKVLTTAELGQSFDKFGDDFLQLRIKEG